MTQEGTRIWTVEFPSRMDEAYPIEHPAESTECHEADGWTYERVYEWAAQQGASSIKEKV